MPFFTLQIGVQRGALVDVKEGGALNPLGCDVQRREGDLEEALAIIAKQEMSGGQTWTVAGGRLSQHLAALTMLSHICGRVGQAPWVTGLVP